MPKNIKRILIAGIAVVVIALAFVILKYVFPAPEQPDPALESAPPATEAPVYYVIKAVGNDVSAFQSTYSDGSVFRIDIAEEGGQYVFTADPGDTFFGYNESKFRSMMYTLTSLTATALIEEDAKDLSVYGLDKPVFQMEIFFRDGSAITLYIGNLTPVQQNYYVMTDQSGAVYTIGNYLGGLIMRQPYEFRNIEAFPKYEEEDIYLNINHLKLTRRDGVLMELWLDEDLSLPGNKSSSAYMMTAPVVSSCTEEKVQALLDVLATIEYTGIIEDIGADRLKEYGFDKPARLNMFDTSGNSIDIVIGNTYDGMCYAVLGRQYDAYMAGEIDFLTVLQYTETDFDWCTMSYMPLLIRAIWIIDIHEVESITYDFNGEIYQMDLFEYDDVTGSGIDVVRTCCYMNGKELNETNTKRIFSRTLNFREVNTISPETVYEDSYAYSITVQLKDGTSTQLSMHKINERQFACVIDGVAEYYVYLSNIETLTTAIQRAMDDREVSLTYTT